MAFILPLALAAVVALGPDHGAHHHSKGHRRVHAAAKKTTSVSEERLLRRRVARLARLALLERRQAILEGFVRRAATEASAFRDDREVDAGSGIVVGPAVVSVDFLGSPLVRARVRNSSSEVVSPLLEVVIRSADGQEARASIALEPLEPGASRTVELACPASLVPVSLRWVAVAL